MQFNHSETIPTSPTLWAIEKLSSTKLVPGAKNVGDLFIRSFKN